MIRIRSLTGRLLLALVVPLIISAVLIGGGGAWVIGRVVDYTSDRLLAGSVHAIVESVSVENGTISVDLPPWSLGLLDSPQRDSVFYSVRSNGRALTGYLDLPGDDARAIAARDPVFRTLTYKDRIVRQATEAVRPPGAAAPVMVSVAQTLESRQAVRSALLTSIGTIEGGLLVLLALFIWPAVLWSLRPLEGLRRQLGLRSDAGDTDFTPVATQDVPTELKSVVVAFNALLSQLERSVEGVRRFTADASHQMRTPIAVVKTHLEVLKLPRRSKADLASLQDASEAVERLHRLIVQLLALARADSLDGGAEQGDLDVAAREAAKRHWARPGFGPLTVDYFGPSQPVPVPIHNVLLAEIIENLIDNAVRYGGARVWMVVQLHAEAAVLEVRDDGAGMSPSLRDRAFDRFVRGDRNPGAGSGLGLSIVRALVNRHGGRAFIPDDVADSFCVRVLLPRTS